MTATVSAPVPAEPLWDWYRIDEEMAEQYKAHGDTYQFIWVRYLLRKMADEYEAKFTTLEAQLVEARQRYADLSDALEMTGVWKIVEGVSDGEGEATNAADRE